MAKGLKTGGRTKGTPKRLDCHKTIANYIHPKMRSIEHIIEDEPQPISITIVKPESTSEPRITLGS